MTDQTNAATDSAALDATETVALDPTIATIEQADAGNDAASSPAEAPAHSLTDEQIAKVVHEAVRAYAEVTGDTTIPSWGWNTLQDQYAMINMVDAARKDGPPTEKPGTTSELIRVALTHLLLG